MGRPPMRVVRLKELARLGDLAESKVHQGVAYADAKKEGAVLGWGQFLTVTLNFLIVATALFLVIKAMNKLKKEQPAEPAPEAAAEIKLLTEIRDLLKSNPARHSS